jgi:two-component system response regulator CpxR
MTVMVDKPTARVDRLLVVDDDVKLCDLVKEYVEPEGFDVEAVHDGERGLERALSGNHALIVLDVMLPGLNGFDVLRRIRAESNVPVLMLTARGEDIDRVVGLEIGADDYLPKPYNPRELVARIRAILRRAARSSESQAASGGRDRIVVGDVEVDIGARVVRRAGELVDLTAVEFALLEVLLRSAGSAVPRHELSRKVLGRPLTPYDRSLDMHVSNLRKKLGHRVGDAERIKTLRGTGYLYTVATDLDGGSSMEQRR